MKGFEFMKQIVLLKSVNEIVTAMVLKIQEELDFQENTSGVMSDFTLGEMYALNEFSRRLINSGSLKKGKNNGCSSY